MFSRWIVTNITSAIVTTFLAFLAGIISWSVYCIKLFFRHFERQSLFSFFVFLHFTFLSVIKYLLTNIVELDDKQ
jgi:hypothetical protein